MRPLPGLRLALCAALLATAAGCTPDPAPVTQPPSPIRLYGSDGNMLNGVGRLVKEPGLLNGMKGTTPLIPLSEDFRSRLRKMNPALRDYAYAGEAYDAIVIVSVATQLARTTDPSVVKTYINGVTNFGTPCTSAVQCMQLARQGADVQYRGVTVRSGFSDVGEPTTTTYGTMHFDEANKIADVLTEYVGSGTPGNASAKPGPAPVKPSVRASGAPLVIGDLTSHTGGNMEANPPIIAGARLALKEINESGGVLDRSIVWLEGDDKTDVNAAKAQLASHVEDGAHVVLGPNTSRVSVGVMDDIKAAGVIAISPSATSAQLSTVDDQGLYFRTSPSDVLQGKALADVILRDGTKKVSIIAMKGAYGEGLQLNVRDELVKAGISAASIQLQTYEAPNSLETPLAIADQIAAIKQFEPQGIVIIGFNESAQLVAQLAEAGLDPRKTPGPTA